MKTPVFLLASLAGLVATFSAAAVNVYQTTVTGQNPAWYFKLDGSFVDSVGGTLKLATNTVKGVFTNDVYGNATSAYAFTQSSDALICPSNIINGTSAAIDTGNVATNTGSITFLFHMLSVTNPTGQRYVFSQGTNSATDNTLQLFLENNNIANGDPNSLKLRVGNSTVTIITNQYLIPSVWYYFAMTYDLTRDNDEVHWYVGPVSGALFVGTNNISNVSTVGDSTTLLTIGNKSAAIGTAATNYSGAWRNTGGDNGIIDEFAVWTRELTTNEITAQFSAAGGNATVPSPALYLALGTGSQALLTWTTNNTSGFFLESSPALPASSWTSLGSGTVVGTSNVVTNTISPGTRTFYRLHHP